MPLRWFILTYFPKKRLHSKVKSFYPPIPTRNSLCNSFMKSDLNCAPLSESISFGIPTLEKMAINASATAIEDMSLSGIASGNPVAKFITVRMYSTYVLQMMVDL